MTEDDDLDALLEAYLEPGPRDPNPAYADVVIDVAAEVAAKLWQKHRVSVEEVEDVIKGRPPAVEEESHEDPELRRFYGFTRRGRGLFVVGAWVGRRLRVITAFEPDDDERYWKRQR